MAIKGDNKPACPDLAEQYQSITNELHALISQDLNDLTVGIE